MEVAHLLLEVVVSALEPEAFSSTTVITERATDRIHARPLPRVVSTSLPCFTPRRLRI